MCALARLFGACPCEVRPARQLVLYLGFAIPLLAAPQSGPRTVLSMRWLTLTGALYLIDIRRRPRLFEAFFAQPISILLVSWRSSGYFRVTALSLTLAPPVN